MIYHSFTIVLSRAGTLVPSLPKKKEIPKIPPKKESDEKPGKKVIKSADFARTGSRGAAEYSAEFCIQQ